MHTRFVSRLSWGAAMFLAVATLCAGCGASIGGINGRPENFYGKKVTLTGRVGDVLVRDAAGKAVAFHLVSDGGERIIVVTSRPTSRHQGDKVKVRGTFSTEHSVGDRTFYDVLVAGPVRRPGWLGIPYL